MNLCILPREMYCTNSARTVADSSSPPTDLTVNTVSVLILPVEKTCKEVGAINTFAKKHENDEIHQAYTKAHRRMDSRKRTMYISKK